MPALTQDLRLLGDPDDAADRRAEEDPDAGRVVGPVEPGVRDRLPPGAEREQNIALELAHLLQRGDGGHVDVLDLAGDPQTVAFAKGMGDRLGKSTVLAKDRAGFIVNFLLIPYLNSAIRVSLGVTPWRIMPLTCAFGGASRMSNGTTQVMAGAYS